MNLSKKHLKQIYRRRNGFGGATVMLSKFFRAAPNNRADYNKICLLYTSDAADEL